MLKAIILSSCYLSYMIKVVSAVYFIRVIIFIILEMPVKKVIRMGHPVLRQVATIVDRD